MSCDQLNAINDAKKYWTHFSSLVGTYKQKVYNDLKQDGKTATTDQERSKFFAKHMENTCQTLKGPQFNSDHKEAVDKFISNNEYIFKPLPTIPNISHDDTEMHFNSQELPNIDNPKEKSKPIEELFLLTS